MGTSRDSAKVLLEADPGFQDELDALHRRPVQAKVEETVTLNLSAGAETRNYIFTALARPSARNLQGPQLIASVGAKA